MSYLKHTSSIKCIIEELILWSEISSEHPIFIKTLCNLTNKDLPEILNNNLTDTQKIFLDLVKKSRNLKQEEVNPQLFVSSIVEIRNIIDVFLFNNRSFIEILLEIKQYEEEDSVWKELLCHIEHEQKFMQELFSNMKLEIG